MKKVKSQKGYAAIVVVMILTMVLLAIAATLSLSGYASRYGLEEIRAKEEAYYLAYGCIEYAIQQINENSNYSGNESVALGSGTCNIEPIQQIDPNNGSAHKKASGRRIITNAAVHNNTSRLQMDLDQYYNPTHFMEL